MEKNLNKFHDRLIVEKANIHEDDANGIDKEYHLDQAIKNVKEAQEHFYKFAKQKTDLVTRRKKTFWFEWTYFIVEWVNHYDKKEIEIIFLYPFYYNHTKYDYQASPELEEYANKIINKHEQREESN